MVWHPSVYTRLLGDRIAKHEARVWLVNTGWTGGPYGVGRRISIGHTRAIVDAALSGVLDTAPRERDQLFNLDVPTECPNVPSDILRPRGTWRVGADYDAQAATLAEMFVEHFRMFESEANPDVGNAGPLLAART